LRRFARTDTPLFANIGGFAAADIAASFFAAEPYVDAVEISLICPNVKPGDHFDGLSLLREVLGRIEGRRKPAVVRIPNDTVLVPDRLAELVEQCVASGIAGLKVAGGRPVAEPRLGVKQGTLHGRPIFERALANVERTAAIARGRIPIKGNGGVSTGADVIAMLRAGATCVDLYSAFVFRGWSAARKINRELLSATLAKPAATAVPVAVKSS
jgi:dihydroorotate dehydrogenase (fumarate)/dihydroorotate dehydrogenase